MEKELKPNNTQEPENNRRDTVAMSDLLHRAYGLKQNAPKSHLKWCILLVYL